MLPRYAQGERERFPQLLPRPRAAGERVGERGRLSGGPGICLPGARVRARSRRAIRGLRLERDLELRRLHLPVGARPQLDLRPPRRPDLAPGAGERALLALHVRGVTEGELDVARDRVHRDRGRRGAREQPAVAAGERAARREERDDVHHRDGGEGEEPGAREAVRDDVSEDHRARPLGGAGEVRVDERQGEAAGRLDVAPFPGELDGRHEVGAEGGLAAGDGARRGLVRPGGPEERADRERGGRGEDERGGGERGAPDPGSRSERERGRAHEQAQERGGGAEPQRPEQDHPHLAPARPTEDAGDLAVCDGHPPGFRPSPRPP